MRRAYLLIVSVFSLLLLPASGCLPAPNYWKQAKEGQKKILVSFPPLYCITHAIAGDDAYVLCLLTTEGPHGHDDFGATDMVKMKYADLFISNGLDLDDVFVGKMLKNNTNTSLKTLSVGKVIEAEHHDLLHHDEGHVHPDGQVHKHGDHDPHIWLGPETAKVMTEIIAAKLAEIDPAHKDGYKSRAAKFIGELDKLKEHGKKAFAGKKHKNIVTQHESLHYFAEAFGLEVVGAIQTLPGTDPDSVSLAKLIEVCKKHQVRVIAVEPQYSRSQAQTLQQSLKQHGIEVGIVEVDPLETAPIPDTNWFNPDPNFYLTKMRENIDRLAEKMP